MILVGFSLRELFFLLNPENNTSHYKYPVSFVMHIKKLLVVASSLSLPLFIPTNIIAKTFSANLHSYRQNLRKNNYFRITNYNNKILRIRWQNY